MNQEIIRHGEVILKPINKLPTEAKLESQEKRHILAHSETGHHHILETLDMGKIQIYTFDGEKYINIPSVAELSHQKTGKDVHTPHKVSPGIYKINIKKEFDYFKGILQKVRD